jgi:hypothetical protein
MSRSLFLLIACSLIDCGIFAQTAKPAAERQAVPARNPFGPEVNDEYWYYPQKTYDERRAAFIDFCSANAPASGRVGIFAQLARLEKGLPLDNETLKDAIEYVYSNADCNDFTLRTAT